MNLLRVLRFFVLFVTFVVHLVFVIFVAMSVDAVSPPRLFVNSLYLNSPDRNHHRFALYLLYFQT